MYELFLSIHNLVRWIALFLVAITALFALAGMFRKARWTKTNEKIGKYATIALDIQLLLGLLLYLVFSPLTKTAMQDFSAAMSNPELRFYGVEHAVFMLLAVVSAHLGSILPRRPATNQSKLLQVVLYFGLALAFLLLGMPWSRPLLRF